MELRIEGFIWVDWVIEKLIEKHRVEPDEVEEAFFNKPIKVRKTSSDKYLLYGRSTDGRYLFVVFVWEGRCVRVISARDMEPSERHYLGQK